MTNELTANPDTVLWTTPVGSDMGYTRRDVEPVERDTESADEPADRSLADVLSGRLAELDIDSVAAVRAVREHE